MMAASLFLLFALAKLVTLWGRPLDLSIWTPFVFLWQDAAIALAFLGFERIVKRRWVVWSVYGALVVLVVANVPVALVLSSPVTVPMLRAARGPLSDSFLYHATPVNLVMTAAILIAGVTLPLALRSRWRATRAPVLIAVTIILFGAMGRPRVDTVGLDRNPVIALAQTAVPRIRAQPADADWRKARPDRSIGNDLTELRGAAAGQNVLVIALESTAAQYLRPYGAAEDPTPNVTALAARSILFENAYAVYPESIKGLVAILASRYPAFDLAAERHAAIMTPSLPSHLSAAGYETALFHSGRFFYLGMEEILDASGFDRREDAGDIGGNHNSSFGIDERAAIRRVLEWIDGVPHGRNWFALYLPIAGHHPYSYSTAGPFPEESEIGRYRNALHEGDAALGELFAGLKQRGLDGSTTIVLIGDHGEAFGQHPGNYGHSLALYEENVRVPLLVFLPKLELRAQRVARTASLIDLGPTILDLLGLAAPPQFEGESLLEPQARAALFLADYSRGLLGLRDGCYKFIHELEGNRSKLFDLCTDPFEQSELSQNKAAEAREYRARLLGWSAAQVARVERAN